MCNKDNKKISLNEKAIAYLHRIGLDETSLGDYLSVDVLNKIQLAHAITVPYENLDILKGTPLSLDQDKLYEKIVTNHKGGYCFELNGLYGWLLRELGFKVTDLMARYLRGETEIPMRRHRVLKVELDGEYYLCDVGVGQQCPRYPVLIKDIEQNQFGETYKIVEEPFFGHVLYDLNKGEWKKLYSFTGEEQLNIDFVMPSFYCEKHPESIFNKQFIIAIKTLDGRKTLDGNIFKIFSKNNVEVKELTDSEIPLVLKEHFGLKID